MVQVLYKFLAGRMFYIPVLTEQSESISLNTAMFLNLFKLADR